MKINRMLTIKRHLNIGKEKKKKEQNRLFCLRKRQKTNKQNYARYTLTAL